MPSSSEAEVTSTGNGVWVDKIKVKFPANCKTGLYERSGTQLLGKAYIATNYPNLDMSAELRFTPYPNAALPRVIDESLFEEGQRMICEALLGSWDDLGAQPSDSFLEYLATMDPAPAFDANCRLPYGDGQLRIAETIVKKWLASDAEAAFRHLSAVEDLPTSVRLMLVQSISVTDIKGALKFIEGSPEFTRGMLVNAVIAAVTPSADHDDLWDIYTHFFEGNNQTGRISGQYYRIGLELLVDAAQTRAPQLTSVFVEGIASPDVRDAVERRVRR